MRSDYDSPHISNVDVLTCDSNCWEYDECLSRAVLLFLTYKDLSPVGCRQSPVAWISLIVVREYVVGKGRTLEMRMTD